MKLTKLFVAAILTLAATPSFAAAIPILNFSFEDPPQALGSFSFSATNWVGSGGALAGVFRPTAGELAPLTNGVQTGYSNLGSLSQVLAATLTSNTLYTLKVDFFARIDCCIWQGSEVDLIAGSTVQAFGQIGTLAPGGTQTTTVTFTALPGNPNLGQALTVQIAALNLGSCGACGQIDFDNVRLDATAVSPGPTTPEPGTWGLLAAGILLIGIRRRYGIFP